MNITSISSNCFIKYRDNRGARPENCALGDRYCWRPMPLIRTPSLVCWQSNTQDSRLPCPLPQWPPIARQQFSEATGLVCYKPFTCTGTDLLIKPKHLGVLVQIFRDRFWLSVTQLSTSFNVSIPFDELPLHAKYVYEMEILDWFIYIYSLVESIGWIWSNTDFWFSFIMRWAHLLKGTPRQNEFRLSTYENIIMLSVL